MADKPKKKYRVLLADDEPYIPLLFEKTLKQHLIAIEESRSQPLKQSSKKRFDSNELEIVTFDIVFCKQAAEAVEAVKDAVNTDSPFSVAFLDILMPPGHDGIWAAKQIRALDPFIEIVLVTSHSEIHPKDFIQEIPPLHKILFFKKPFRSSEIYHFAASLSAKWEAERKLHRIQKDLELTVQERTRDLEKANQQLIRDNQRREKTVKLLEESEETYRTLTENIADGVALIQNGEIVFANSAFAKIYGYTKTKAVVGKIALDFFAPESKVFFNDIMASLSRDDKKQSSFQGKWISQKGEERWTFWVLIVVQWKGKSVFLASVRDITDRKLKEMAMEQESLVYKNQVEGLKASLKERYRFGDIVGKSKVMQEVYERIIQAGVSEASVVVFGESGTGKELIARTIHKISHRKNGPFVPVNCGAIPETLFESEFFGHKKGAYTGAVSDHKGFFERAHKGTLFLDEVGEFTYNMQVKMLRAMEGGGYTPVGDQQMRQVNVRIVAATNKDLGKLVKNGNMREDFYYRLNVIPISVPPLRDRREDIVLLVEHMLNLFSKDKQIKSLPPQIMDALTKYNWPGNIRQLQNVIQRYLTLNQFDPAELRQLTPINIEDEVESEIEDHNLNLTEAVSTLEKRLILQALEKTRWHKANAATILGIPRRTLFRKIKLYEIK
jgi:PAS domain S-box-containing protein